MCSFVKCVVDFFLNVLYDERFLRENFNFYNTISKTDNEFKILVHKLN